MYVFFIFTEYIFLIYSNFVLYSESRIDMDFMSMR